MADDAPRDETYTGVVASGHRVDHGYGPRVHVLADPWTLSVTTALSHPDTVAPHFHRLLEMAYRRLIAAASEQLPTRVVHAPTRMTAQHPGVGLDVRVLDPHAPVVLVDIARGGIVPTYVAQQVLLELLDPAAVRIDHLYMQRTTDAAGRVTGVRTSGSKIGGPVAERTLIVPDPMAATGSSVLDALAHYRALEGGPPARCVACHLICTPEYLRRVAEEAPELTVYTLRVDRGLSDAATLAARLGDLPTERGLDAHDYIVPGAGGLGELINNAFV